MRGWYADTTRMVRRWHADGTRMLPSIWSQVLGIEYQVLGIKSSYSWYPVSSTKYFVPITWFADGTRIRPLIGQIGSHQIHYIIGIFSIITIWHSRHCDYHGDMHNWSAVYRQMTVSLSLSTRFTFASKVANETKLGHAVQNFQQQCKNTGLPEEVRVEAESIPGLWARIQR